MLPKNIRELRIKAGLSQGELAKKIGVSQVTVSKWETNKSSPNQGQEEILQKILGFESAGLDVSPIAAWVNKNRIDKKLSIPELAQKSGLTYQAISQIEKGITRNLRESTRKKLESVLGAMPEDTRRFAKEESNVEGIGSFEDFDPYSLDDCPSGAGIYVFYDISERPIYIGQGGNVRSRIKGHSDKFWFKRPIVDSASWINIEDEKSRKQLEEILIKFLKSNAIINIQHVDRDNT